MSSTFLRPIDVVKQLPVKAGAILADFGTGQGHFAFALAKVVGEAGSIYAVDILPRMVDKVKKEASRNGFHNIHVLKGDLEKKNGSTLKDVSVHGVAIVNVLFQAENPQTVFKEAARIVQSGGWCAAIDWISSRQNVGSFGPSQEHIVLQDDVRDWAKKAGFSFEQELVVGDNHFGLLFRKK